MRLQAGALSARAARRQRTAFTASVAALSAWNAPWLPKTRTASTPAQGVTRFREKRPIATTASAPAFAALPAGASGREPFAPRFAATADVRFGRDRGFSGGRSLPPLRPARILIPNGPARVSDAVGIVPCRADEHDSAAGTRALEGVRNRVRSRCGFGAFVHSPIIKRRRTFGSILRDEESNSVEAN